MKLKKFWQEFSMRFGVNPYQQDYNEIPTATRFFRNIPLIETVNFWLNSHQISNPTLYFHACSTGEEPYSFAMYALENRISQPKIYCSDFNSNALQIAKKAIYNQEAIEVKNHGYIANNYKKYFTFINNEYHLKDKVKDMIFNFSEVDYTKIDNEWVIKNQSDVVFCNSSLLYQPHNMQERALEALARQAKHLLVLSGVENNILTKVLTKYNYVPYELNWERIYDGCKLRRVKHDPLFRTPTTPYLSDKNKFKEHFFKYSIFEKFTK
jgi:chemotaxis methyl-accepting protein methylase